MNLSVTVKFQSPATKTQGLSFKGWEFLKTQTNFEQASDKKDLANYDFFGELGDDIKLLKLENSPVKSITLIVSDCGSLGKIVNRSIGAFRKMDLDLSEVEWDADSGLIELTGNIIGREVPTLVEILIRMMVRASGKFSNTRHLLSIYDLKQTIGLIKEHSDGIEESGAMLGVMVTRELAVAEVMKAALTEKRNEAKAQKAIEKAKAEAAAPKTETTTSDKPKAKEKPKTKAKAKPVDQDDDQYDAGDEGDEGDEVKNS